MERRYYRRAVIDIIVLSAATYFQRVELRRRRERILRYPHNRAEGNLRNALSESVVAYRADRPAGYGKRHSYLGVTSEVLHYLDLVGAFDGNICPIACDLVLVENSFRILLPALGSVVRGIGNIYLERLVPQRAVVESVFAERDKIRRSDDEFQRRAAESVFSYRQNSRREVHRRDSRIAAEGALRYRHQAFGEGARGVDAQIIPFVIAGKTQFVEFKTRAAGKSAVSYRDKRAAVTEFHLFEVRAAAETIRRNDGKHFGKHYRFYGSSSESGVSESPYRIGYDDLGHRFGEIFERALPDPRDRNARAAAGIVVADKKFSVLQAVQL